MKILIISVLLFSGCSHYTRAAGGQDTSYASAFPVLKKKKIVLLGMVPFKTERGSAVNPYSGDPDFLKMLLFIDKAYEQGSSESRFSFSNYRSSGRYGGGGYQSWKREPDKANSLIKEGDYGRTLKDVKFGAPDANVREKDFAAFTGLYYQYYGFHAFADMKKIAVFPKDEKQKNQLNFTLKARSSDADYWVIVLPSVFPGFHPADPLNPFSALLSKALMAVLSIYSLGLIPFSQEYNKTFYYTVFDSRYRKIRSGYLSSRKETYLSVRKWNEDDIRLDGPNSPVLFETENRRLAEELAELLENGGAGTEKSLKGTLPAGRGRRISEK